MLLPVGTRNSVLDNACDLLSTELRPIPPQPNCPQSMKIYEDHRKVMTWTSIISKLTLITSAGCRVCQDADRDDGAETVQGPAGGQDQGEPGADQHEDPHRGGGPAVQQAQGGEGQ